MRRVSAPALVNPLPYPGIAHILAERAREQPDLVLYTVLTAGRERDVTARQFRDEVVGLARGMAEQGVRPGDRVGILSRTRYEWSLVDFALWWLGAVPVPVYDTSSPDQIAWILSDSEATGIFVESEELAQRVREAARITPFPAEQRIRVFDTDTPDVSLESVVAAGAHREDLADPFDGVSLEDTATLIYTSGTTGPPKGCELTHRNFVACSQNTIQVAGELMHEGARTLLFLPLAHVFARFVEVTSLDAGIALAHTPDVSQLMDDLARFKPSFILAVPRVFEKILVGARFKAQAASPVKKLIFERAVATAAAWSKASQNGRVSPWLEARHRLYDRLVYSTLREAMGGEVRYAVSGGAALGEHMAHFFNGIGVYVVEGYGLTETTAPISANVPSINRLGTVGHPMPGNEVAIAEDGEILVRGVNVFERYNGLPEKTAEAFRDGWFATGDLGHLDDEGLLTVTGRKKEIIVTAGGKNVIPNQLEDPIRTSATVGQVMAVGDNRPFVAALVTLDPETLPKILPTLGLDPGLTLAEASREEAVVEHVQRIVDHANAKVSRAESIRAFRILDRDLTVADGYLTPSLKLKRAKVAEDFADVIEDMYTK
ncbi:long-chain fatty acid--CoA ligase [Kocuria tytonicola]|uniref:Long-chain fatty acid--CoA ligase n=1 Tax=Kocuria tytonicola TaxID=2055946 RepID=A0A3L9KZP4_9MICC|nr:long-chain fatty acid--CoA ligase [Kocuria tytonicola]RLY91179.1 long-chain fatty acid--CoA ligase [Kocuria tytonicola]